MIKRLSALLLLAFTLPASAQSIEDEALLWLQEFIKVDTINPPGNETRAVEYIANILEAEGIPKRLRAHLDAAISGHDSRAETNRH